MKFAQFFPRKIILWRRQWFRTIHVVQVQTSIEKHANIINQQQLHVLSIMVINIAPMKNHMRLLLLCLVSATDMTYINFIPFFLHIFTECQIIAMVPFKYESNKNFLNNQRVKYKIYCIVVTNHFQWHSIWSYWSFLKHFPNTIYYLLKMYVHVSKISFILWTFNVQFFSSFSFQIKNKKYRHYSVKIRKLWMQKKNVIYMKIRKL